MFETSLKSEKPLIILIKSWDSAFHWVQMVCVMFLRLQTVHSVEMNTIKVDWNNNEKIISGIGHIEGPIQRLVCFLTNSVMYEYHWWVVSALVSLY